MSFKFLFAGLVALCSSGSILAQDYSQQFGFQSDNDSYLANGQDRYYTNGLFISWRKAAEQTKLSKGLNKKIYQLEIGQKMYNAQSGYIPDIVYVDRPITAYLYAGAGLQWLFDNESVLKASVQIGTIGPAALGRQAQELVHRLTGLYTPRGWEYQLNNEFGLNTQLNYSKIIQRSNSGKLDLLWSGVANLGTTFTSAGLGFTLRVGKLNQLYQTVYNRSNIWNKGGGNKLNSSEFFFFARPQLDLVVYDASVSGGLFRKDKGPVTYQSKPLVLGQEFGLMLSKKRLSAQLSYIFRTNEIKGSARPHQYGSISTYYHFK